MSLLPPPTAGRRRPRSQDEPLHMTLGRSINGDMQRSLGGKHVKAFSESDKVLPPPPQFVSKLPPAVASVPLEDVKSYVHSKRVTHYQIGSTLGEGSFAKVKEGFHVLVGEKVAVKVIDKKKAQQDPYVSKNFRREAKLLQMVHHPNILQLLEVVETDNSYYLITELCSGGDLMNYIYKKKQLDEKETRKYMRQMVSAVDHLHKAGIIHRDLKVENLLLDFTGNIKIIDFGLSNEEYVMEAGGRVHCSTQCGSPAYAAPELLGHKPYGPEVDIWSLGVNMYAMLTGCLPYTVEPFNITALHAKMLENKMNPIPSTLSKECSDLLQQLLTSDPVLRIKMPELMAHAWMTEGNSALKPHPFPNKLCANDINEDIVEHMVHVLKLKEREEDVTVELLADRACATCAIYNLLLARLNRYNQQKPKVKLRKKSRYASPVTTLDDDDDAHSMISCPPRTMRDNRAPLRPVTRDSKLHQVTEESGTEEDNTRLRQRRRTLPSELMKDDIAKLRQNQRYCLPPVQCRAGTLPRSLRNRPDTTLQPHRGDHEVTELSRPPTHLNPVRPPPMGRSSASHPKDLHKLRQDLNRHGAWNSQPSSQASSLAGSRNPSRKPSASSRHSMTHHRLSGSEFENDLEFHHVETVTHPADTSPSRHPYTSHSQRTPFAATDSSEHSVHFPSITARCSRNTHQRTSSHGSREVYHSTSNKNGYWSATKQYEFRTEKAVSTILHDMQKTLGDLNITCTGSDQKTHTIYLRYQSITFTVHVDKDHLNTCQLHFQWLKGGSQEQYKDLCSQIFRSLC